MWSQDVPGAVQKLEPMSYHSIPLDLQLKLSVFIEKLLSLGFTMSESMTAIVSVYPW